MPFLRGSRVRRGEPVIILKDIVAHRALVKYVDLNAFILPHAVCTGRVQRAVVVRRVDDDCEIEVLIVASGIDLRGGVVVVFLKRRIRPVLIFFVDIPDGRTPFILGHNAVDRRRRIRFEERGNILRISCKRLHAMDVDDALICNVLQIGKRLRLQRRDGKDEAVFGNRGVGLRVILADLGQRFLHICEDFMIVFKHNNGKIGIGLVVGRDGIAIRAGEEHDVAFHGRIVDLRQADGGRVCRLQPRPERFGKGHEVRQIRRQLNTGITFLGRGVRRCGRRCIVRIGRSGLALLTAGGCGGGGGSGGAAFVPF